MRGLVRGIGAARGRHFPNCGPAPLDRTSSNDARRSGLSSGVMSRAASTASQPQPRLERRVAGAAEALLARDRSVSPIDVLVAIGWLLQRMLEGWRRGRVECLEGVAPVHADKLAAVLEHLRRWAAGKDWPPARLTTWPPRGTGDRCASPPTATRKSSAPGAPTDATGPVAGSAGAHGAAAEQAAGSDGDRAVGAGQRSSRAVGGRACAGRAGGQAGGGGLGAAPGHRL